MHSTSLDGPRNNVVFQIQDILIFSSIDFFIEILNGKTSNNVKRLASYFSNNLMDDN
jgi:hypothetical protein